MGSGLPFVRACADTARNAHVLQSTTAHECMLLGATHSKSPPLEKLYNDGAYGGKCAHDIEQAKNAGAVR